MVEQHTHAWGEWRRQLWYTPEGRLQAEFRTCSGCTVVEPRSIEQDSRPRVLQPTIGVFGGLYDSEGRVLVKQIETGRFAGEWDAPGGGVDADNVSQVSDERMLFLELARHVKDEVGILLVPSVRWKVLLPAVLSGGGDWAFPVVVGPTFFKAPKGTTRFLSPADLDALARGPEGNRILSGHGKRMHRILLRLLSESPNPTYQVQAEVMLGLVHGAMGIT